MADLIEQLREQAEARLDADMESWFSLPAETRRQWVAARQPKPTSVEECVRALYRMGEWRAALSFAARFSTEVPAPSSRP